MVSDSYDFWVFDLDGTLIDVEPSYIHEVMGRVGARLGHEFTPEQAEAVWHSYGGDPNDSLKKWGLKPSTFWTTFHEEEDALARAEATFLYRDAERFGSLEKPLALVTHCQSYLAEPVLDHLDIADWFDAVLCCTDETGWKPDPAPVRRVVDSLGLGQNGHRGVLAGDGPHDIGAAWNAGLDAVHVERHGHERRGSCVLGDHRVTSFDELF
jgi:phosphoglycolate phosphatase